jgi:putative DNA primase/helicase
MSATTEGYQESSAEARSQEDAVPPILDRKRWAHGPDGSRAFETEGGDRFTLLCESKTSKKGKVTSDWTLHHVRAGCQAGTRYQLSQYENLEEVLDYEADKLTGLAAEAAPPVTDLATVLDGMVAEIRRYTILDPHLAETIALWVTQAHASEAFRYSPRLRICSPIHGCGKTTLQAVIRSLSGERGKLVSNLTIAAYFRFVDGASKNAAAPPIMLIDEVDTFLDQDRKDVLGILNSGHDHEGSTILRCLNSEANHEPREFSTWAPLVLGGIGYGFGEGLAARALESRCIFINLRRKLPEERVEKLLEEGKKKCVELGIAAASWVAQNFDRLRKAEPETIPELFNRAQDNWSGIFAIADAAGPRWAKIARDAAAFLSGEAQDSSESLELLRDARMAFGDQDRISSRALLDHLHSLEERPWGAPEGGTPSWGYRQLGKILAAFSIKSQTIKFMGRVDRGFYRSQFEPVWASYLAGEAAAAEAE